MYAVSQEVVLKKSHPCGGNRWVIVKLGADVKLQCKACGRFLTLTRDELKKREKPAPQNKENEHV